MNAVYNISQLFEIAFGIRGIAVYDVGKTNELPNDVAFNYNGLQVVTDPHEAARLSALGTPIILPIIFKGGGYNQYNELGEIFIQNMEGFEVPATALVSMRRNKIITKTKATAAGSTIKEIYGFEDWRIDIRGFCLADTGRVTHKTAYDQKKELNKWFHLVDSIHVVSELLNDLGVDKLAIEELNFDQLKGAPGIIPFYMRCTSDADFESFVEQKINYKR